MPWIAVIVVLHFFDARTCASIAFFLVIFNEKRWKINQTRTRSLSNTYNLNSAILHWIFFKSFLCLSWFRDTRLASKFVPLPSSLTRATAPLSPYYYYLKKLILKTYNFMIGFSNWKYHTFLSCWPIHFFNLKIFAMNRSYFCSSLLWRAHPRLYRLFRDF